MAAEVKNMMDFKMSAVMVSREKKIIYDSHFNIHYKLNFQYNKIQSKKLISWSRN